MFTYQESSLIPGVSSDEYKFMSKVSVVISIPLGGIIGDWNAKIGSQETPGITDKFGLGATRETPKMGMFCDQISSPVSFMCNLRESSYTKSVTECILIYQERL